MNATSPSPTPAPAGTAWIDLETAARRSGKSVGHWRRMCGSGTHAPAAGTLLSRGMAKLCPPPDGGKPSWYIREDADATLARVKFAEQLGTDLRDVPEAKRKVAYERRRILVAWSEAVQAAFKLGFDKDAGTGRFLQQLFLDEGIEIVRGTLYNWDRRWRAEGLRGLVDRRGGKSEAEENPFMEEVKRFYLSLQRPSRQQCYRYALDGCEPPHPSYRTACRFLDTIPKAVVLRHRHGQRAYEDEAEPFIERDYTKLSSNEWWNSDHYQFDVICQGPPDARGEVRFFRPWLTSWQDMRSRKLVGWKMFQHDPNTGTILDALRMGCIECGLPEHAYMDNGADYDSFVLQGQTKWMKRSVKVLVDEKHVGGVFTSIGAKVHFCWKYHGQSKTVEAMHHTIADQFCKAWPTYCGKDTLHKPQDLSTFRGKPGHLQKGHAPTLEELTDGFRAWLAGYHGRVHTGQGMDGKGPETVWRECLSTKRTMPQEVLDLHLLERVQAKIHQNGVTYRGLRYGQFCAELQKRLGQTVYLRVGDLSEVMVFAADDTPICVAPANAKIAVGSTGQDLRDAIAEKRRAKRVVREYMGARPKLAADVPELMARAAAAAHERSAPPDPALPPPTIMPVRTALEDHLPAIQRAMEKGPYRIAVGAESMSNLDELRPRYQAPAQNQDEEIDVFSALGAAMSQRTPEDGGGEQ
jgi:hypothetical protein